MAIINFGRFARDDLSADPEEAKNSLREVLSAAERAAGLTRQLLAFSRRQAVQRQPLNLNDIVANLAKMLRRLIPENISLDVQTGDLAGAVLATRAKSNRCWSIFRSTHEMLCPKAARFVFRPTVLSSTGAPSKASRGLLRGRTPV